MNDLMEKLGESPYELNEGEPMEPMEPMEGSWIEFVWNWKDWMRNEWNEWDEPYESECESLWEWVWVPMRVSEKVPIRKSLSNWVWNVPIEMSISESPYQNVHIKMSTSKYQFYLLWFKL